MINSNVQWLNDRMLYYLNSVLTLLAHYEVRDMDEEVLEMARVDTCSAGLAVINALAVMLDKDMITEEVYDSLSALTHEALNQSLAPDKLAKLGLIDVKDSLIEVTGFIMSIPNDFVLPEGP
jgi:hypothetical protein